MPPHCHLRHFSGNQNAIADKKQHFNQHNFQSVGQKSKLPSLIYCTVYFSLSLIP